MNLNIYMLIKLAGLAQLVLSIGSLAVPKILNWKGELAKTHPLVKQMFWVYAAYILVINVCFGLISIFAAGELATASVLSTLFTGFIAMYWISRVLIQFIYFERANFPHGKWHILGEAALVACFIFLSGVYSFVCYCNLIKL